jgi:uncharacterized protein YyaL (SSP411 family)
MNAMRRRWGRYLVGPSLVIVAFATGVPAGDRPMEVEEDMHTVRSDPSTTAVGQSREPHTNRLAGETSPYLLQHAHNPVDWYPWGEEALSRARRENKPIFLSIGYSACHWCHVMERESFEDPEIAKTLNARFVCIKVDREERPDLDEVYMTAVQLMTGTGGWPLNVFLTPELKPFYGGTYFPPVDRYGRPGFPRLLERVARTWRENPEGLSRTADELTRAIKEAFEHDTTPAETLDATVLSRAAQELERVFDPTWGGFGRAPKFPPSGAVAVLLRQYAHTGEEKLLEMATTTLNRMAYGGMYDHLGGGFHRYSTDDRWLVPHFEKMLYDNALLSRVYLEAWQVTGKALYRRVATEILDYVLRDMVDVRGGFHSAEDADSEGEEGKFYVWRPDEIEGILGDDDGAFFCEFYGVTAAGNFEGRSILHVPREPSEFAEEKGIAPHEMEQRLARLRGRLREARDARVRPAKDDKVIAAWNGMMVSALARGYQVLGEARFLKAAERAANFGLTAMVRDGGLLRTYRAKGDADGSGTSKLPAYLNDYAEMANALIDLYEATFDLRWLEAADRLVRRMVADFRDEKNGGFFYTALVHKDLLVRTKPYHDGAVPSGNATAAYVLLRLSELLGRTAYRQDAEAVLTSAWSMMLTQPRGYLNLLCAADFFLHPSWEIAIAGKRDSADAREFLELIHGRFIPNKVLAQVEPGAPESNAVEERIPLLRHKGTVSGKTTVYLCEDYQCKRPITDPAALIKMLDRSDAVRRTTGASPSVDTSG